MKYRITTTFPVYFNGGQNFCKKRKCRKNVENASMNLKRKEVRNELRLV